MTATLDRTLPASCPARDGPAAPRRPGVLLALRDPAARTGLAGRLSGHGFDVWTAGTGADALGLYAEQSGVLDVLVVDAGLRDLPGPAFLRRLRSHFPAAPCVFLTDPAGRPPDLTAEAVVVPTDTDPGELAARLWEVVAGEGVEVP